MVNSRIPPALILVATLALTACGDIKGALDFADDREDFESRLDTLQGRSNTAYLAVPDTGEVTFRGEATLGVGSQSNGVALVGDATITVDYTNSAVTGALGNFSGFDNDENFSDYAGTLVMQDGVVGSVNPNDVEARIVGELRGDTDIIGVDAFWEGHLKATPIIGVLGDTTPSQSTFELNGQEVPGTIVTAVTE